MIVARDSDGHWYVLPSAALRAAMTLPAEVTRRTYGVGTDTRRVWPAIRAAARARLLILATEARGSQ